MQNTSGNGISTHVPPEVQGWNWGAFFLHFIWGIGNNTFIAFLIFVPFVNLAMPFILGAKGNEWAWRNRHWASIEEFKRVQRLWSRWAIGIFITITLFFALLFTTIYWAVTSALKSSEIYQQSVILVKSNPSAMQALGSPISTGTPRGNISVNGDFGEAKISFSIEGSKTSGILYVSAEKEWGTWQMHYNKLRLDNSGEIIDLLTTEQESQPDL
ncbi:cytochrome c oxidase assembly factor Coa1 family protein [Pragia fontium]|uniref:Cytochrome oxidase complex assembly protein 1 n=2 Tax=Pragia fontium TaxID=82985 RepID=A0AAJ4WC37_9GAMM|nr:cytochrome c oxidase assembly factor Coa1 family protein [Pragia fontium]AKJ42625.1 hypothetical protein QQ39_11465 [Pragia fontium]SFD13819.1 Cytochrome oxidase complex assembly protein 1 [Pragia fontium DSM 5563 = ATCC 49100]SUB82964.1 Cytochrome oxidase complex assembly protein 1 [Pragia fontium]VEJ55864.1 Cytochrome oxidase complex assembly protein 1 [Pragia fontium]GKX62533.1 hypothetical protein SOASR032_11020 [Pragia fontium]